MNKVKAKLAAFWSWLIRPVVLAASGIGLGCVAIVVSTLALNAGSEDKTSDWISAFGTLYGAALTGGALLVAALSYRKQVADRHQELVDRHEAQAIAITVGYELHPDFTNKFIYFVHNGSNAGIYNVRLYAVNDKELPSKDADVVPPGKRLEFDMNGPLRFMAAADFDDSANVRWRRDSRGGKRTVVA